jgi:DNA-binding GntR family transcriptional regulator
MTIILFSHQSSVTFLTLLCPGRILEYRYTKMILDNLKPIQSRRNVLSDYVYEALCQQIIEGKLIPNERLREAQVAKALGVSRTPVREAFAKLEHQYLLRKDTSGAYFIQQWDRKTLDEVATLRSVLEGLAIRLACRNLSPDDFDTLQDIILQMDSAHQRDDYDKLIALDIEFHSTIWARCGHNLLRQVLDDMKAQILYFMYTTRPGDEKDYPSTHRELLEILRAGDQTRASETIQAHIHTTAERAMARLSGEADSET